MKMVASAKLHRAQSAIGNMLPYEERLHSILFNLIDDAEYASGLDDDGNLAVFASGREVKKVAVIAFSSNSSLCGGFNTNAIRNALSVIASYRKSGMKKSDIKVYSIGRKMAEEMKKRGFVSPEDFSNLSGRPSYEDASRLAEKLIDNFVSGNFDKIILCYNHFKSTASQPPVVETYLPVGVNKNKDSGSKTDNEPVKDFIVEPDINSVVDELLVKVLRLKIYTVLLDTSAAEHAARTVAMQTATDNGNEILGDLTLEYNKDRQQKITNELLDLEGGSQQ
jgi:F-type H+-transporting ATPase subunit gamma